MGKIKIFRGRRVLSSILIIAVLYCLAPNIFSHDRYSANRLLSWLLFYQIFIFLSSAITISLLFRFLNIKYAPKISNYIFGLCWNDVLLIFSGVSLLHTAFMLASVNVIDFSSVWLVKGINFDIVISLADTMAIIVYFYNFYTINRPKKLLSHMLRDLNSFEKEKEREKVNEQFSIIKEFIKKTNSFFDTGVLFSILDNSRLSQPVFEHEKNDNHLELIVEMLFENLQRAFLSESPEEFKRMVDFLNELLDRFQDSEDSIFDRFISAYFTFILGNIGEMKTDMVLYFVRQLENIFERLFEKQIGITEKSKSDLIGILDRLSYIVYSRNLETSEELFSILEFYICLFAYFEKDYLFYSQLKDEFDTFVIFMLQNMNNVSKKEAREYFLKLIEKTKLYKIAFAEMVLIYIFLLALEYKMWNTGYVFFNVIMDLAKTRKLYKKNNHLFYHFMSGRKIFYLKKCLSKVKNKEINEVFRRKIYKKYLISIGSCSLKELSKCRVFRKLAGRK